MKKNNANNDLVIQNTDSIIDNGTGQLLYTETTTNVILGNEPPYFKVYTDLVNDLSNLCNLNHSEKAVFLSLAKNMSFSNTVILLKPVKELIMQETGIKSLNTLNKAIDILYKKKFIIRKARSFYIVNPNLIGKGKWEDNKSLRLIIEYSENGKQIEVRKINSNMLQINHKHEQKELQFE